MNENENNFTSLKRLLAFKNRETPPPGYFNGFSSNVLAGIRAGEARKSASAAEQLLAEAPWLVKFLQIFEAKPAFTGAFALALCMVLVFGIVYAERPDSSTSQPLLAAQSSENPAQLASVSPESVLEQTSGSIMLASDDTNPAISLQPVASFFGQPSPNAQQVSFTLPGN